MRTYLLACLSFILVVSSVKAQERFSEAEFNKKLGKTGTLCDTVYSLHIFSDTLTLLNMGGIYPNQKYTIAVKGNKVNLNWTNLKGKPICVTGVFAIFKNRPEIEVTKPDQINAH